MVRFLRPRATSSDEPEPVRISTPAGARLSTILENGGPPAPKRSRGMRRLSLLEEPKEPKTSGETSKTTSYKSLTPSPASFGSKIRGQKQVTKRGGWKRLAILGLLLLLILCGLIAGLVVGLKKRKSTTLVLQPSLIV